MILTCPSCGTQYAVKDGAIPEVGRKVRCASCGHSWHQMPEGNAEIVEEEPAPAAESAEQVRGAEPSSEPDGAIAAAAEYGPDAAEPEPGEYPPEPEAEHYEPVDPLPPEEGLVEETSAIPVPPPDGNGWANQVAEEEQFDISKEIPDSEELAAVRSETGSDRRRSWLMGVVFAILLVVVIVAGLWLIAPDSLRQRLGFAAGQPSPLQIAAGTPERQKRADGNEAVVVSGRVINPSAKAQTVPPIQAELRDKGGKLVYSWTIAPPAPTVPPGGSVPFNSYEMDVPKSGLDSSVTLTLKS